MNKERIDQAIQEKTVLALPGTDLEAVKKTELELGFKFPEEYIEFLTSYGAMSIKDHEIFGIAPSTHLDVLGNTLEERARHSMLSSFIVVENLAFDGMLVTMDENGFIYEFKNESFEKISDSFEQYVNQLIG